MDFVMLSVYTGLRISDVATFDIKKTAYGNDVPSDAQNAKGLYTWILHWLVTRLRARAQKYGTLIFRTDGNLVMRTMAELWRVKLNYVFKLAGPFETVPTAHRFRHTFVRILLEKGVPVTDVAELIGDTEEILRMHYSKWVKTRQERSAAIREHGSCLSIGLQFVSHTLSPTNP